MEMTKEGRRNGRWYNNGNVLEVDVGTSREHISVEGYAGATRSQNYSP